MSKQASQTGSRPRPLTHPELQNIAAEFDRLGRQLEGAADTLREAPENPLVIGDMRLSLSLAGRILLKLLHHGAIDGPTRMPPWLSWSSRGLEKRPRFSGLGGFSKRSWSPSRNVRGLIQVMDSIRIVSNGGTKDTKSESPVSFRHRQVFLEATAGWLGHGCTPRISIQLPSAKAEFAPDVSTDGAAETAKSIAITFDWDDQSPTRTRSLFLEIGRAASAACRHLAHSLQPSTPAQALMTAKPECPRTPTQLLHDLQDLMTEASWKRGEAVHAALFGDGGIHADLVAIAAKRPEFELRPSGPIQKLTHFAVASGHEALAKWSERVEGCARVRKSGLPRAQAELAEARQAGDAKLAALREVQYQKSVEYFAEAITNALKGFQEDFDWIERAIRAESIAATATKVATPTGTHDDGGTELPGFFRDGDGWTVRFGGQRTVIKDSKGMSYLQRLLRQPGTPIEAADLGGLNPDHWQGEQVVIDQDMARDMRRRLLEIDNALEAPQGPLLQEERDALERERANIREEAARGRALGRSRVMKSEQGAVQGSVRAAIRRAMETLKEKHEPLWKHLESSLIDPYGTAPCYRPSPSITWMTGE